MTDADCQRLEEIEKRQSLIGTTDWPRWIHRAHEDLTWLLQLVADQTQLIRDLQEESAAYRRGAEDMRGRAAHVVETGAMDWPPATALAITLGVNGALAAAISALPLIPPAAVSGA